MSERVQGQQTNRWMATLSRILGWCAGMLGVVVLLGWYRGSTTLIQVHPTFVPMQYNTALGLALSGFSLALLGSRYGWLALFGGGYAVVIGVLTLLEYALGVSMGIDQLFMHSSIMVGVSHPGRMAPNTALCFILLGTALLLAKHRPSVLRWGQLAGWCAWGVCMLGLTALGGYLLRLPVAYGWEVLTRMAMHTAAGMTSLSVGLLLWLNSQHQKKPQHGSMAHGPRWLISLGVLASALACTLIAWQYTNGMLRIELQGRFAHDTERIALKIRHQVVLYENELISLQGLYRASKAVDRDEFSIYLSQSKPWERYPGIVAVDYVQRVPFMEREAFEAQVRSDRSLRPEGYPAFAVHPDVAAEDRHVITYIEPLAQHEAILGLDLGFEANRRAALERARDSGDIVLTEPISLVGVASPGALLVAPIYRNGAPVDTIGDRRVALQGFVLYVLRLSELFAGLVSDQVDPHVDVDIFDETGATQTLLFNRDGTFQSAQVARAGQFQSVQTIEVGGRRWKVSCIALPGFGWDPVRAALPLAVLVAGLLLSLLLFGAFYVLASSQERAVRLAAQISKEAHVSEQRYAELFAGAPDPILTLSLLGQIETVNQAAEQVSGYHAAELIGKHFTQTGVVPASQLPLVLKEFALVLTGQVRPPFELEILTKDHRSLTMEVRSKLLASSPGRPGCIQVVFRDVTERRATAEHLHSTAEQFRTLVANVPGAVYRSACDGERTMAYLSDGIEALCGYPPSALTGAHARSLISLTHPNDRLPMLEAIRQATARREPYQLSYRLCHADGGIRWVHDRGQGIFDRAGRLVCLEGVMMDETDRMQLQAQQRTQGEAIAKTNAELLRRERVMQSLLQDVQAGSDRLKRQEQQLLEANKRLKELGILKDEFVAKVSHELRTPLTSTKEGLNLLIDQALGPINAEQLDFLRTMDRDVDRLAELINNMLDLSKIEAGRMRLNRGRLDILTMLENLAKTYEPILGRRSIRWEGKRRAEVFGDANRLFQVLTNLFSNALKFTPEDGAITFHLGQVNGMVTIGVEDNGPGMSPQDLPKLFQKFAQVGPQAADRPRGTGLGLVICKELIELHGGRIDVASVSGQGTTFTVSVPAYSDQLALQEYVRDIAMGAEHTELPTIAVIAMGIQLLRGEQDRVIQREELAALAEDAKRHLHRGDLVLPVEPGWVVVIANADTNGAQAIIRRLRTALPNGGQLCFGVAHAPAEQADALALFAQATQPLNQRTAVGS